MRKRLIKIQTRVATHVAMSRVLRNDAASVESEIPVPSATYAARQAGHLGSNAKITVGTEHFARVNRGCAADGGWVLPSAVWFASRRDMLPEIEQHV